MTLKKKLLRSPDDWKSWMYSHRNGNFIGPLSPPVYPLVVVWSEPDGKEPIEFTFVAESDLESPGSA
jgi:hypothetical protein